MIPDPNTNEAEDREADQAHDAVADAAKRRIQDAKEREGGVDDETYQEDSWEDN